MQVILVLIWYKVVCVYDKFRKLFMSYLGEETVQKYITNMAEESKCSNQLIKKYFNKEFVMTREDNEKLIAL